MTPKGSRLSMLRESNLGQQLKDEQPAADFIFHLEANLIAAGITMLQPFYAGLVLPTRPEPGGTRKANAMTPEKLAQKRASDREAQRKIRARTKEYIERLEKEIEQLKSQKCRDQKSRDRTIQSLLRRNEAMEKELVELKQGIELLEQVLPSDNSVPYHLQTTEPVAYSTLPLDENNRLAGDDASCYPQGSQLLMNNNGITEFTRLQNPSSSDPEGSGSSANCPETSIMSNLLSTGCAISYDPAALYTTLATANCGYFQSMESTYSQDMVRNNGIIATSGELNPEQLLS